MKGSINFIRSLLNKASAGFRHSMALKKIRVEHPDCTILSSNFLNVSLGNYVSVLERVRLFQVDLGNYSYISNDSCLVNVRVGSFCSIGANVQIGLAPHPSRVFISTYPAFYSDQNMGCPLSFRNNKIYDDSIPKTRIASDVWMGSNIIIPGGINIGTGAIIAAGSVVVKDVPPYAVVGGNPAKLIRYRFTEQNIQMLLTSEWWHWPIEKIIKNVDGFSDIKKFKELIGC